METNCFYWRNTLFPYSKREETLVIANEKWLPMGSDNVKKTLKSVWLV